MVSASADVISKVTQQIAQSVQEQLLQLFTAKGRRVIVIAGPTGVGKTDISLRLAETLGGEIISADSIQVYLGMDIGTAKVSLADRDRIPHHLIDVRDIIEPMNVHDYFKEAKAALDDILARNKVPIIVGGTGFYIHSLLYGPPQGPPSNPNVRRRLEQEADRFGIELLYDKLQSLDPIYASTISPNDQHKITRALEIIEISGRRVSEFSWKVRAQLPSYDFRCWFLSLPRKTLYERLSKRCEHMLETGLLQEVVNLDREGLRDNRTARQAIGYRQTLEFFDTAQTPRDYQQFVIKFKHASYHLAKRQFTWFRKEQEFRWIDISTLSQEELIDIMTSDYSSPTPISPQPPEPPKPPTGPTWSKEEGDPPQLSSSKD